MLRVHEIGGKGGLSFRHYHYAIQVFQKELIESRIDFKFFTSPLARGIEDCDVLIFNDDNYRNLLPIKYKEQSCAVDFLQGFFTRFSRVIWFDQNDSSGWIRSYIFPLVDHYMKPQVMKDVNYYQEKHKFGVAFRDYVFEKYNIDDSLKGKEPITSADCEKLKVGWNLAFSNWHLINLPYLRAFPDAFTRKDFNLRYKIPNLIDRCNMIPYRVNFWENKPTVYWWRKKTLDELGEFIRKNPDFRLNPPGRVNKRRFHQELQNAIVTVSPFGIGEICFRDFEAFMCGSLLLKPCMAHLSTWPDLYVDGETYIAHSWDFSDFHEKLDAILTNPRRYEDIAREGQRRFQLAVNDKNAFVSHFRSIIM